MYHKVACRLALTKTTFPQRNQSFTFSLFQSKPYVLLRPLPRLARFASTLTQPLVRKEPSEKVSHGTTRISTAHETDGTQASKDVPNVPVSPRKPIPRLPPAPPYPPPFVIQEDLEAFFYPLYTRDWFVDFRRLDKVLQDDKLVAVESPIMTSRMFKIFKFGSLDGVQDFIRGVGEILHREQCDLDMALYSGNRIGIYTFSWLAVGLAQQQESAPPRQGPGITRNDIRLALMLEKLYAEDLAWEPQTAVYKRYHNSKRPMSLLYLKRLQLAADDKVEHPLLLPETNHTPLEIEPLPALPPPPDFPCLPIDDNDLTTYLKPLNTRGWGVTASRGRDPNSKKTLLLSKMFHLKSCDHAFSFAQDYLTMAQTEKIAPLLDITKTGRITIRSSSQLSVPQADNVQYGITHRDIRVAIGVEQTIAAKYSDHLRVDTPLRPYPCPDTIVELNDIPNLPRP